MSLEKSKDKDKKKQACKVLLASQSQAYRNNLASTMRMQGYDVEFAHGGFHLLHLLENEIDAMENSLPQMTHFVLPGGHTTVSYCHIARCVCRRAERLAVHLNDIEPTDAFVIKYLNRLSDYLFVLARKLSNDLNAEEVKWIPEKQ